MFDLVYSFSDRFRLFAFTGPELSLGLSSKLKSDGVSISMYDVNQEEYFGDGKYRRFDILWGYGVGVDLLGFLRIKASCDSGLLDRVNTSDTISGRQNMSRALPPQGGVFREATFCLPEIALNYLTTICPSRTSTRISESRRT